MKKYTATFRDGAIATCRSNEVLNYAWRVRRPCGYAKTGFSTNKKQAQRAAKYYGRSWVQIIVGLFKKNYAMIEIEPTCWEQIL